MKILLLVPLFLQEIMATQAVSRLQHLLPTGMVVLSRQQPMEIHIIQWFCFLTLAVSPAYPLRVLHASTSCPELPPVLFIERPVVWTDWLRCLWLEEYRLPVRWGRAEYPTVKESAPVLFVQATDKVYPSGQILASLL